MRDTPKLRRALGLESCGRSEADALATATNAADSNRNACRKMVRVADPDVQVSIDDACATYSEVLRSIAIGLQARYKYSIGFDHLEKYGIEREDGQSACWVDGQ